jgi:hypothetical protein
VFLAATSGVDPASPTRWAVHCPGELKGLRSSGRRVDCRVIVLGEYLAGVIVVLACRWNVLEEFATSERLLRCAPTRNDVPDDRASLARLAIEATSRSIRLPWRRVIGLPRICPVTGGDGEPRLDGRVMLTGEPF